ncbi:uncharacterized protein H6S33_006265 [Morchella sextelata]|uniref:uncharacterized protein n=1 Tax=Morchella sextelata TaxID=1174677 RepID=UPI001D046F8E|nr:uncharacterized protein H6S33_006265 [Morchella sextelata]KAH0604597.1 hypothetical protein H6S33_006265 [Morchella sextelata]
MRNDTVAEFNDRVLQEIQGEMHTCYSADTVDSGNSDENTNLLPPEYLQSLNPSGLPLSILKLKVGAPIILLYNLYPKQGLCNGTRMTVTRLGRRCIEAKILDGEFDGEPKVIPRIQLSSAEGDLPFIIIRRQLPIRLCFAVTVNKSQGQSLDVVRVDLRSDYNVGLWTRDYSVKEYNRGENVVEDVCDYGLWGGSILIGDPR